MDYENWKYIPLGDKCFYAIAKIYSPAKRDGSEPLASAWRFSKDPWRIFRLINN
jgi:hypothetical protein